MVLVFSDTMNCHKFSVSHTPSVAVVKARHQIHARSVDFYKNPFFSLKLLEMSLKVQIYQKTIFVYW